MVMNLSSPRYFSSIRVALLAATCLTQPAQAVAQVTVADTPTTVYNAPNGVAVVDIAGANAAGLSHNRYTDYNVDARGLVLNNSNADQVNRKSQLAGQIMFNPHMKTEATVILNEVVSARRSSLNGYTEVVGGAADVIVANPYGVTCNGCGFINSPNVTLTTGTPDISGDHYRGVNVSTGDVLITGTGLDGTAQDYMSLVARSVKVEGQVNANDINIVTGVNSYDHATGVATATGTGTGAVPAYAIDSTALGGIYAGSIRFQATEAGVGVRALGDVAANGSDFTIDAAGKIQLDNRIYAQRDIAINTTSTDAEAIKTNNARLTAQRYVALGAQGGIAMQGGTVVADDSFGTVSTSFTDTATTDATNTENNKRYAGNVVTINTTGAANLDNTSYGAGNALFVDAGSVNVGSNGATLYSDHDIDIETSGNIALGKAGITAKDVRIGSTGGSMTIGSGTGQGIKATDGDVTLISQGLTNNGDVTADAGNLAIRSGGTITNNGALHASGTGSISDATSGATADITNTGTIVTEGALTMKAATLTNSGGIQGNGATVTAGTLTNSGTLQSAGALAMNITNSLTNSNKILSDGAMTVRGTSASAYSVSNAARIESNAKLDIKGQGGSKNVNVTNSAANAVLLGDTVDINATAVTLANNSSLTSKGDMALSTDTLSMGGSGTTIVASSESGRNGTGTITVGSTTPTSTLSVPGAIHSGHNLVVSAPRLDTTTTGAISALNNLTINATENTNTGNFTNNGAIYAGKLLTANINNIFQNTATGTIDSDDDIAITTRNFTNNNDVIAKGDINISAADFANNVSSGDNRVWVYRRNASDTDMTHSFKPFNSSDRTFFYDQDNFFEENYENNYEGIGGGFDSTHYYRGTFTASQVYNGGKPTNLPRIIGGTSGTGTFTLRQFNSGQNIGGLISAPTVTLQGNSGASFTNDSLALMKQNWAFSYNHYYDFAGDNGGDVSYRSFTKSVTSTVRKSTDAADNIGAGIFAGTINGGGFTLFNEGGVKSESTESKSAAGAADTTLSGLTFGGANITLPTNPNGYFVVSQNPNSRYLIETNPRFANGGGLGSDYMAKRYGIDPDNIQRRLGDAGYENSVVRDQLVAQTGTNQLNRSESEAQQMQRLMDNGVDQGKEMGLKFGQALSADQVANLKEDMVWMVETEVQGQKVLAPVVYLSAATKSMFEPGGATMMASNVNLNLDGMTNNGGTIGGTNNLNIASRGDINNNSGTIRGGNVSLSSSEGSINNRTVAQGTANTDVGQTATIAATGNLNLNANRDITNTGANMSAGGNANLIAGNNIIFDTVEDTTTSGSAGSSSVLGGLMPSSGGNTATTTKQVKSGLTAGGNLSMEAGNDLTLAGTDVTAGGNAGLNAGNDLNIIAREDRTSTTSKSSSGNLISNSSTSTTDTTTTNVGSTIKAGGDLTTRSTGNTTIQGSDLEAGGNADIQAHGDLNILDGKNTRTTTSSTSSTGLGVGGGVYGTETEEKSREQSNSVASNIKSGGNMLLGSDNKMTVQGSNIDAGGNLDMKANDIQILEGRNIDNSTSKKSTTTFLSVDSDSSSDSSSGAEAKAKAEDGKANAYAGAVANAEANGSAGLALVDTVTTTTNTTSSKAVGSSIKSGGNTTIKADNDVLVRGSTVDAGGDVDLSGKNVTITSAEDVETSSTTTERAKVGFFAESNNSADAEALAEATADRGGADATAKGSNSGAGAGYNAGDASVEAKAGASAKAGSDNTLDIVQHTKSTTTTKDVTNQGSLIKSGGNQKITAAENLNVHGSDIEAGGDVDLKAKDMSFTAAEDSHTYRNDSSTTRAGLYAETGAGASAEASGEAKSKGLTASGEASAEAGADAGVGLRGTNTTTYTEEGSTTARTSSIKSGGNVTREAEGKISDVGTQIEAEGDFTQTATEWESKAAKDTSYSKSGSTTHTAKAGLYAEAGAEAKAEGEAKAGIGSKPVHTENEAGAEAGASAGAKITYDYKDESKSNQSSDAVVSNIKTGGNFKSTTTDKTSLEGTNIEAGKDAEMSAKSLDYKAATNTSSSSSTETNAGGELKAGVDATKAVTGTIAGSYDNAKESESSTEAVVGGIKAGNNLKITTTDDARFEGTNLEADNDAKIDAGGDVKFDAARNTSTKTEDKMDVSGSISASKSGKSGGGGSSGTSGGKEGTAKGIELEGGFEHASDNSSEAVVGSIKSGNKLDISSGKSATFEGTQIESGGDASVTAKDNVNFNAAKSTSSSEEYGASAAIKASKGSGGSNMGVTAEGNYGKASETTNEVANIKSGGNLKVDAGKDVNLEGTNIEAKDKASIKAGDNVNFTAAEDTSESLDVEASLTAGKVNAKENATESDLGPSANGRYTNKKAEATEKEGKKEAGVDVEFGYSKSNTKNAGSVNAGSLDIESGKNTTLEGTNITTDSDTNITAGGDVKFDAAKSSSVDASFAGGAGGEDGALINDIGVGGESVSEGSQVKTGGDLTIKSGGKATFEGTKADVAGKADIDTEDGVEENSAVSGGGQIGLTRGGASIDVKKTSINAGGGVNMH